MSSTPSEIFTWAEEQSWCKLMSDCAQDAEWHSEGDVWKHTKLVCQELLELEEWPGLSEHDRSVLFFTALLHDAAKPLTSQVDSVTGRITSPKHAVKGEYLARNVLRDLDCDLRTREQIARLVRYHGRPTFLAERASPEFEVIQLSWLVNNRLLYLFALADFRGRDTDSKSRPEENLHYWKLLAEELECLDRPYPFATDHSRFTYFRSQHPNLHYVPHEDFTCRVTMLSGLPGSGKDSWAKQNLPDEAIVSLDAIRRGLDIDPNDNQGEVVQLGREQCREYLRSNKSFIFNATNLLRQTRMRWVEMFADYGARINMVYIEPKMEKLLRQNRERDHVVPEPVIRRLAAKCEPPTWLETHSLSICDGESKELRDNLF